MIGQELKVDDYVVSYNNIYQVKGVGRTMNNGSGYVKIMLIDPSKTTRPATKHSSNVCKVDAGAILFWILKKGN